MYLSWKKLTKYGVPTRQNWFWHSCHVEDIASDATIFSNDTIYFKVVNDLLVLILVFSLFAYRIFLQSNERSYKLKNSVWFIIGTLFSKAKCSLENVWKMQICASLRSNCFRIIRRFVRCKYKEIFSLQKSEKGRLHKYVNLKSKQSMRNKLIFFNPALSTLFKLCHDCH